MILFTTLFLISFILYARAGLTNLFIRLVALELIMLMLFLFEYSNNTIEYLISDGLRYYENPGEWIVDIDRSFWGYVNLFVKNYDVYGDIFIKFINVPILFIFILYLKKTFNHISISLILLYPFLLFLSISNLRDILIWLFALMALRAYYAERKKFILLALFAACLYTLRPFMAGTMIASILIIELSKFIRSFISRNRNPLKLIIYIIILTAGIGVALRFVMPNVSRYFYNAEYVLNEGFEERLEYRTGGSVESTNKNRAILLGHVRYLITPLPTSKIKNLLSDSPEVTYGYSSEIFRTYSQFVYYYLLLYLAFNFRYLPKILRGFSSTQISFLIWLFAFFPIYSIAHFGTGHQRLKLPFQIFILIIYLCVNHYKSKKYIHVE